MREQSKVSFKAYDAQRLAGIEPRAPPERAAARARAENTGLQEYRGGAPFGARLAAMGLHGPIKYMGMTLLAGRPANLKAPLAGAVRRFMPFGVAVRDAAGIRRTVTYKARRPRARSREQMREEKEGDRRRRLFQVPLDDTRLASGT